MNRRQVIAATSALSAGAAVSSFKADVRQFGAAGDGKTDDADALQAALDHVGRTGGGVVLLPSPAVNYRLSKGLKLPSNVTLEGPAAVQYPFNAGNRGACALVADFDDPHQWIIEPATLSRGRSLAPTTTFTDTLPDGVTYNCAVRNLLITSTGVIPFGGIRMHGCPGSIVEGVSIDRVGCGLLVNYSFGGFYKAQIHSLYYGAIVWDDANANIFELYCTQSTPWPTSIPQDYQAPFMRNMAAHYADTLKLSEEGHSHRPYGLICGSSRSTSTNNVFDLVVERFAGGMFLFNAYATDFRRCYIEAPRDVMACAIAATRSRFSVQALHAYLSGTGALFDLGIEVMAKIFGSGVLHASRFGKAPENDGASLLLLEGISPAMQGAPLQPGIRYATGETPWSTLQLQSGWRPASDYESPATRIDPWTHRVEFRGSLSGGRAGKLTVLPPSCRPPQRRRFAVAGGTIELAPDGLVLIAPDSELISLDGVSFARW